MSVPLTQAPCRYLNQMFGLFKPVVHAKTWKKGNYPWEINEAKGQRANLS